MSNTATVKPKLYIMIGVPGSGKTTLANQMLKQNSNAVRVNRDDIRKMIKDDYAPAEEFEAIVSSLQDVAISASLKKGYDVILDNTNCRPKYIKDLINKHGVDANISLQYVGQDVTLKELYSRNKVRDKQVPEEVIEKMYKGFATVCKAKKELYELAGTVASDSLLAAQKVSGQDSKLPKCILVDIDGTVAHMKDKRGPFEWHKVGNDDPDNNTLNIVRALAPFYKVIFMSGRDGSCREETEAWLTVYYGEEFELFMRKANDFRKDSIVKVELYNNHIKDKYYVEAVFDDRDQVVKMWREELGLKCMQVAYGNF